MCFSPEMDAATGVIVTAIGIDALRRTTRPEQVALAALPILFGVHQFIETFVWLQLQGHVSTTVGDVAAWIYLAIALIVVPIAVPYAFLRLGIGRWPQLDRVFVAAGVMAAVLCGQAFLDDPGNRLIEGHQISYVLWLPYDFIGLPLYMLAACGPALAARSGWLQAFGVLNLVVVLGLAALNQSGVISLWCVWAAITSVLINVHIRRVRRTAGDGLDRAQPAAH